MHIMNKVYHQDVVIIM